MSGICGVVHFGGKPLDNELLKMSYNIKHRGLGGVVTWREANAGFSKLESNNLHDSNPTQNDRYLVVADVRLDNRAELISKLNPKKKY